MLLAWPEISQDVFQKYFKILGKIQEIKRRVFWEYAAVRPIIVANKMRRPTTDLFVFHLLQTKHTLRCTNGGNATAQKHHLIHDALNAKPLFLVFAKNF